MCLVYLGVADALTEVVGTPGVTEGHSGVVKDYSGVIENHPEVVEDHCGVVDCRLTLQLMVTLESQRITPEL
jgi:hypothetical protein